MLAAAKSVSARSVLVHTTLVMALHSQPTVGETVSGKETRGRVIKNEVSIKTVLFSSAGKIATKKVRHCHKLQMLPTHSL